MQPETKNVSTAFFLFKIKNDPYAIRTHHLPLRRRPLYPNELMGHAYKISERMDLLNL